VLKKHRPFARDLRWSTLRQPKTKPYRPRPALAHHAGGQQNRVARELSQFLTGGADAVRTQVELDPLRLQPGPQLRATIQFERSLPRCRRLGLAGKRARPIATPRRSAPDLRSDPR